MRIGPLQFPNPVVVAPMAGVTDRPYRQLCKRLGAGYAVSEMAASNPRLWNSVKSSRRLDQKGEAEPVAVQIAGSDPGMMAEAAVFNIQKGRSEERRVGKSVSVRVELGGRRILQQKKNTQTNKNT